ncbi:MAG: ABC transporter ATP-binding protein [Chitinophagaceae bacterium]|nr:ABC transporter ATP-binding protein [Chitinophagaceae bacterium]
MLAVKADNLVKNYGKKASAVKALKGISFEVQPGELFGIIGPDGSGKTSLFRILTTLLLADEGTASVDGFDVVKDFKQIRERVGYMPGKFSLYPDLSVAENLEFFATIFDTSIEENYDLIRDIYVQIEPFRDRKAGKLSGGMKQKLALSCALIHRPSVLFLDEPTTGVDSVSRKEFWAMLKTLQTKGISILVSTPYMDEAAQCDKVALLQDGNVLTINTPAEIVKNFDGKIYGFRAANMLHLLNELKGLNEVQSAYPSGIYHNAVMAEDRLPSVLSKLKMDHPLDLEQVELTPTIEDCFMALMK